MCLIFFALNQHPKYALILAANRDEFYNRPAAPAGFWEKRADILAGRDLQDKTGALSGTWLGITKSGRIAMITNYRDFKNIKTNAPSRGPLVTNYLSGTETAEAYLESISKEAQHYNGFNLLAGTIRELRYYSNYENGIRTLTSGIFGISNHLLDTPWPKLIAGKRAFTEIINNKTDFETTDFLEMMADKTIFSDEKLPDTGAGIKRERMLSPAFIESEDYGTRCTTVILVTNDGDVSFVEKSYKPETGIKTFTFTLT
ncbi:MAG: NRDE family protein [Cyclobacteriaceae bacterium]